MEEMKKPIIPILRKMAVDVLQELFVEKITEKVADAYYSDLNYEFCRVEDFAIGEYMVDVEIDNRGEVIICIYKNGEDVDNEELKKVIYDAMPDWDLVRVDAETDGVSRYDWCDPAFNSIDEVNGMFFRV